MLICVASQNGYRKNRKDTLKAVSKDFSGWKKDSGEKGGKQHRSLHFKWDKVEMSFHISVVIIPAGRSRCCKFMWLFMGKLLGETLTQNEYKGTASGWECPWVIEGGVTLWGVSVGI